MLRNGEPELRDAAFQILSPQAHQPLGFESVGRKERRVDHAEDRAGADARASDDGNRGKARLLMNARPE